MAAQSTKTAKEEAMPMNRSTFQQRLEELKIRVMDKALRDMDITLRILKDWMQAK